MKTVAIVQARLNSQRMPAKVLRDLCGKPMLAHVMDRLKKAARLDAVVVALPDAPSDDPLAEFCSHRGYPMFRGSENDVLLRYREAARAFQADVVVRVTSDCPLIDPQLVDAVVDRHLSSGTNDYTCNVLVRTYPRGMDAEVFSMDCLERLHRAAREPIYREHISNYILDHKNEFKMENVARAAGDHSCYRVCVDTPEDFSLVEAVLRGVKDPGAEDVIAFLDRHTEIARLNAGVQQKVKTLRPQDS